MVSWILPLKPLVSSLSPLQISRLQTVHTPVKTDKLTLFGASE